MIKSTADDSTPITEVLSKTWNLKTAPSCQLKPSVPPASVSQRPLMGDFWDSYKCPGLCVLPNSCTTKHTCVEKTKPEQVLGDIFSWGTDNGKDISDPLNESPKGLVLTTTDLTCECHSVFQFIVACLTIRNVLLGRELWSHHAVFPLYWTSVISWAVLIVLEIGTYLERGGDCVSCLYWLASFIFSGKSFFPWV